LIVKVMRPPLNDRPENDDWSRPSSQVSICLADTTGTPRARAASMTSLARGWPPPGVSIFSASVCMFAVTTA
jgi:hypothetical protein